MEIKVKFVNKECLEEEIKTIKGQNIKWITQNDDQYTIIYEDHENKNLKTISKNILNL